MLRKAYANVMLKFFHENWKIFDFETESFLEIWTDILKDINDYKVEELRYSQQMANAFTDSMEKGERLLSQFKRWKQETPNPIKKLAQKLNSRQKLLPRIHFQ
jgi:hypothetical protein